MTDVGDNGSCMDEGYKQVAGRNTLPPIAKQGGDDVGENKRYYWLKLKTDFFASKEIKKLRKIAGGDTYTIIYLKMLLMSVKTDGKIYYESIEDTFADELALELDEDADNVLVVLNFLERHKLIERGDEAEYFLPEAATAIGSETQGAERVRKFREKQKALRCNNDVTLLKRSCNTEKEIEKDIELDIDIEKEKVIPKGITKKKSERHKYGQYFNVLLSDEEMEKLMNEFPWDWQERIERLSEYIASKGAKYKNHLATIRAWARKDKERVGYKGGQKARRDLADIASELDAMFESEEENGNPF